MGEWISEWINDWINKSPDDGLVSKFIDGLGAQSWINF